VHGVVVGVGEDRARAQARAEIDLEVADDRLHVTGRQVRGGAADVARVGLFVHVRCPPCVPCATLAAMRGQGIEDRE
jgi:hypothetical protein